MSGFRRDSKFSREGLEPDFKVYDTEHCKKFLRSVEEAGDSAVPMLLDALINDLDFAVRERAASELRHREDPAITDVLIKVLENKDEHPFVREMVAEAIGCHDVKKAIPALVRSLSDPSPEVRFWSIQSIGLSHDRSLIPLLRRIANRDTGVALNEGGPVTKKARQAISELKNTSWNRSSRKMCKPIV